MSILDVAITTRLQRLAEDELDATGDMAGALESINHMHRPFFSRKYGYACLACRSAAPCLTTKAIARKLGITP